MTKRLAMWSGPRNISTAMMRSFENRPDCEVIDEPFYAFYLHQTRSPHPCFNEILAAQSSDFSTVANRLSQQHVPSPLQYQKHMTHHMLPEVDLQWCKGLLHCFLIREPAQVVNSYTHSRGVCNADDIGIIRQAELYREITQITGQVIPVIDSNDVLKDPQGQLKKLCKALEIEYFPQMVEWPKGRRDSDGVWASHWYHSVEQSTGFSPYMDRQLSLSEAQKKVVEDVSSSFDYLYQKRIQ
jgi:hypothetical protein